LLVSIDIVVLPYFDATALRQSYIISILCANVVANARSIIISIVGKVFWDIFCMHLNLMAVINNILLMVAIHF
jgi:hypothetical protein